jgi:hypothetical protein
MTAAEKLFHKIHLQIDLSALLNGIYILKVDGASQSFSQMLIKQ